jgi:hypothetical protein
MALVFNTTRLRSVFNAANTACREHHATMRLDSRSPVLNTAEHHQEK